MKKRLPILWPEGIVLRGKMGKGSTAGKANVREMLSLFRKIDESAN